MINVISKSIVSSYTRGPRKVVANTLTGLDEISVPYVVNRTLSATDLVWIHDDPVALTAAVRLAPHVKIIAGPNIYTVPSELPPSLPASLIWLHPAPWVKQFWDDFGGDRIRSVIWPTGIDTEYFTPQNETRDLTLVYNKMRTHAEITAVCSQLTVLQEPYEVLTYGTYHEAEYRRLLNRAKAIIWVGRSESQGIALLEAMAMNVPVLVWDITHFGHWEGAGKERFTTEQLAWTGATAAPYFDSTCGIRITSKTELTAALTVFFANLPTYTPRNFVVENLSLARQASLLTSLFTTELGASEDAITDTNTRTNAPWRNATRAYRYLTNLKGALRRFLR